MEIEIKLPKFNWNRIYHKMMKRIWIFPFLRNFPTCSFVDLYFDKLIDDEQFDVIKIDEHYITVKYSEGEFKTWIANANYACCDSGTLNGKELWSNKMPSRWNVRRFMKKIKSAQMEQVRKSEEEYRKKLGI